MNLLRFVCIFTLLMHVSVQAASRRANNHPQINYIVTGPMAHLPTSHLDAVHLGSLHGTEGGVGILVKSFFIAVPAALFACWGHLRTWYEKRSRHPNTQQEKTLHEQTRLIVAHTKYAHALAEFLEAQQKVEEKFARYKEKDRTLPHTIWMQVKPKKTQSDS